MDARLEQIFREEVRQGLGMGRITAERLMQIIAEFPVTAPPEEVALFTQFIRSLASGMTGSAPQMTPEATTTAPESSAMAPLPVDSTGAPPRVTVPFRVPYPAPARSRAVAPEPVSAPELDPIPDDIEDFTATGS